MYVALTIMMIRSTRVMSTKGVTLMPTIGARPPRDALTDAMADDPSGDPGRGLRALGVLAGDLRPRLVDRALRVGGLLQDRPELGPLGAGVGADQLSERQGRRLDLPDALLDQIVGDHRGQGHEQAH